MKRATKIIKLCAEIKDIEGTLKQKQHELDSLLVGTPAKKRKRGWKWNRAARVRHSDIMKMAHARRNNKLTLV